MTEPTSQPAIFPRPNPPALPPLLQPTNPEDGGGGLTVHSQVDPGAVPADFCVSVGDEGGVALVPSLVLHLHVADLQGDAVDQLQAASVLRMVHLQKTTNITHR